MIILSLFGWWYTVGWFSLFHKSAEKIKSVLNFFSVPLLVTSLFAPFRQISAGRVGGPLNVRLQAWADKLFSRFMGAIIRSILIIIGVVTVLAAGIISVVAIVAWPFLPVAPLLIMVFIPGVTA